MSDRKLRLFAGSRLLGHLEVDGLDWPRTYAAFEPAEAFEEVRTVFDRMRQPGGFAAVRDELDAMDLRIVALTGEELKLRALFLRPDRATWRAGFIRSPAEARPAAPR